MKLLFEKIGRYKIVEAEYLVMVWKILGHLNAWYKKKSKEAVEVCS